MELSEFIPNSTGGGGGGVNLADMLFCSMIHIKCAAHLRSLYTGNRYVKWDNCLVELSHALYNGYFNV